eukprot:CAMPEP_0170465142 /NCGR_PEP_ID=MMETSP0123-20130129/9595_1 /TAXON_ID=182087 /ORGANISM="Favella ehrenbergii, Strain Fehren 1" /LENGTH=127 /DNA_ID=CAMNT_0010730961 /DNA_START=528 /DNA_END=913 /DNA_ORIENTATION=-
MAPRCPSAGHGEGALGEPHESTQTELLELDDVGIRDIDPFEGQTIKENNIRVLDPISCIDYIKNLDGPIHISFDVDALDPELVDSTGTKVPDGLEPEEVRSIIKAALELDKLVSLDVVEFNKDLGDP